MQQTILFKVPGKPSTSPIMILTGPTLGAQYSTPASVRLSRAFLSAWKWTQCNCTPRRIVSTLFSAKVSTVVAAVIPIVGLKLAPIAAAMAVAAGAIQIAAIKKQQQASQAQGYSKGGFTKPGAVDEPAGVVHAGEWVASQKLLANPVARPMIDALDYAQRTNTIGSLRLDDVSRSITANNSLVRIAESDGGSALMVAAAVQMSHTVDNLTDRLNKPFVTVNTVTGDKGIKQAQDEYSRLMNNVTPKSKRK